MIMIQTRSHHQTFFLLLYVVLWWFNYVPAMKNPGSFYKQFYLPKFNEHFYLQNYDSLDYELLR